MFLEKIQKYINAAGCTVEERQLLLWTLIVDRFQSKIELI